MFYLGEAELEVSVVEAERLEECLAEQPRVQPRQLGRKVLLVHGVQLGKLCSVGKSRLVFQDVLL